LKKYEGLKMILYTTYIIKYMAVYYLIKFRSIITFDLHTYSSSINNYNDCRLLA